ncbi:MAG: UDP-N-acetylglucosamine--N-acetylmuramyl-(pentapeptide) pyrophosphoryl-undecaprenol N-acetylglucosamine transferase, partial [Oribacterium parvum]|nr:UDP-N-acetylglucosamine--N-acetylmuramyl-(pentapeptide) pyrophosphoryl-undecaprenol N-acetylglucosamine transferase [Oribacterium parvum]
FSVVLPQEELEENPAVLPDYLEKLHENKEKYIKAMEASKERDGRKNVLAVIQSVLDEKS